MRDFFTYLPLPEEPLLWDAAVTSAGFVRTAPNSDYPPPEARHPSDHLFTEAHGRVLDNWQILLIRQGRGWFESVPTGRQPVSAGTVFILFPGIWHRYAPDRATGWEESWIELKAPVLDRLRQLKKLEPRHAIFPLDPEPELKEAMDDCLRRAQNVHAANDGRLATRALHLVALVLDLKQSGERPPGYTEAMVQRARALLLETCDQPLQIRSVARTLGVSESHFRRAFKMHTGLSPKRYWMDLRLRQVRALLQNTSLTVAEIAERMGYHTAFHLSAEFKKQTGLSPLHWRRRKFPGQQRGKRAGD